MDTKEFLNQYKLLQDRIKDKELELLKLKQLSVSISSPVNDIKVSSSKKTDKLGDMICTIIDLSEEIANQKFDLLKLHLSISKFINDMDNQEDKRLLELRYLHFMKWEEIADSMGYSIRNVHRIHNRALLF